MISVMPLLLKFLFRRGVTSAPPTLAPSASRKKVQSISVTFLTEYPSGSVKEKSPCVTEAILSPHPAKVNTNTRTKIKDTSFFIETTLPQNSYFLNGAIKQLEHLKIKCKNYIIKNFGG